MTQRQNTPHVTWTILVILLSVRGAVAASAVVSPAWAAPALPQFRAQSFVITDFGAVGDGKTQATPAIEKAIRAASDAGGGVVVVPAGRYVFSPFALKSGINLRLDPDATLLLMNDMDAYPKDGKSYIDGITAEGCSDIAITGHGTIDGQGQPWWEKYRKRDGVSPTGLLHRPQLVRFSRCNRVLVQGVTITNSPNFHLIPGACSDVTIESVTITSPVDAPHTDGIDPSGWNFRIAKCSISVGDDNIAIKPSGEAKDGKLSCENFLIEDCTFGHGHGLSIGGQTRGGLRNLLVRNCTYDGTETGIRMKSSRGQGGLVENCRYENLTMKAVRVPIFLTSYYPKVPQNVESDPAQQVDSRTPIWRNIQIRNVTATDSLEVGRIVGLAEQPIENLVISNLKLTAKAGLQIVHAKGVRFEQCQISVDNGPRIKEFDADVLGYER